MTHHDTPATVHEQTPAQLLRGAAVHIDTHGWHQGCRYEMHAELNPTPPACAAGALCIATYGSALADLIRWPEPTEAQWRALGEVYRFFACHLLGTDLGYRGDPGELLDVYEEIIGTWNDHDGRTAAQVTTALREAADGWDRLHPCGGAA
jgi:hypothetical protein